MTTTLIPETHNADTETDLDRLVELTAALEATATALRGGVAALDTPGARRRGHKLAQQVHAAARLVARGTHLEEPAVARRIHSLCVRSAPVEGTVSDIDARIATWRGVLIALHEWRGHHACLPVTE